jgi:flavin reductase (DIM6/NTAB) family NADH-FMN oxidoreductase RutF
LVEATDLCGLFSGSKVDKAKVFGVFYGEQGNAPMIEECLVCMESRLLRKVKSVHNEFLTDEAVAVHVEESCLTSEEKGYVGEVDPLLYEGGVPVLLLSEARWTKDWSL